MQISDYLGQYANTLANAAATSSANAPAGTVTQNLVSTLTQMQAGTVFEGSINSIDGTKVLLGLSNGQTISARLDAALNLVQGQSVFFQVKSNDGNMISIKPYAGGGGFNPTIQKALDAAGMEMTKDTMDMVNHMMEEGMPIDKQSLVSMRQTLMQNPTISMQTAVTMARLGIPVNDQMAAQFENYQNDRYVMLDQMDRVMDSLPDVFAKVSGGSKDMLQLNQQIITILNTGDKMPDLQGQETARIFVDTSQLLQEEGVLQEAEGQETVLRQAQQPQQAEQLQGQETPMRQPAAENLQTKPDMEELKNVQAQQERTEPAGEGKTAVPRQLGELLNRHQVAELETQLKELFPKTENLKLNTQLTAKEFLDALAKQLNADEQQTFDKSSLTKLFSGKEYHALLKDVMEQQWTVKPEELKTAHKIEELYQRLDRQMGQIEQLAKQTGMNTSQLSQSAAQVRDNIESMHQINQTYTYVQIPLKMANQNAHSDLYVYTNKRNLKKKEGELSAFLHLELENLGSTDVSIKMLDKNVSTKFYLSDDLSYELIEKHLPMLQERLANLGYHCTVTVENREEKVDFVEDFLQKSQPATSAAKGMVHRYSFDVRA